jgi:hypothetical protein
MYSYAMTTSVTQVVGVNVRKLRRDARVTLDQLAFIARHYGLKWTSGRVGHLESGRVGTGFETLYLVAAALGQAIGRPVSLAELLACDEPVRISDALTITPSALTDAVSGTPVKPVAVPGRLSGEGTLSAAMETIEEYVQARFRETDRKICKDLGMTPECCASAMINLWGRTFTDERDHRAGPDAKAQGIGHISRQLKAELLSAIKTEEGLDGND